MCFSRESYKGSSFQERKNAFVKVHNIMERSQKFELGTYQVMSNRIGS